MKPTPPGFPRTCLFVIRRCPGYASTKFKHRVVDLVGAEAGRCLTKTRHENPPACGLESSPMFTSGSPPSSCSPDSQCFIGSAESAHGILRPKHKNAFAGNRVRASPQIAVSRHPLRFRRRRLARRSRSPHKISKARRLAPRSFSLMVVGVFLARWSLPALIRGTGQLESTFAKPLTSSSGEPSQAASGPSLTR